MSSFYNLPTPSSFLATTSPWSSLIFSEGIPLFVALLGITFAIIIVLFIINKFLQLAEILGSRGSDWWRSRRNW